MDVYSQIEKPTLLLDCAAAKANLHRMAQKAAVQNIRFRPHFKTHQSAEIAGWFRDEGVSAITVSSLDMAEYFAKHGWLDITIAFSTNLRQLSSIRNLATRIHLGLLVESRETVEVLAGQIDSPVDFWIKVDVGNNRTGLLWEQPETILAVADAVRTRKQFTLRGLLTHAGQTYSASSADQAIDLYRTSLDRINKVRMFLFENAFSGLEVSVGDTPGCSLSSDLGAVDEIRPGNFIFYDAQQLQIGACQPDEIAVAMACPVVATHPERSEVVLYGGAIHLSKDYLMLGDRRSYGLVAFPGQTRWSPILEGAYIRALSQEHGIVYLDRTDFAKVKVGDLLIVIPAHSCLTVTAMKTYLTLDGQVIDTLNVI